LQCVAVCCSVLQCVAVCCSVLQNVLQLETCEMYSVQIKKRGNDVVPSCASAT